MEINKIDAGKFGTDNIEELREKYSRQNIRFVKAYDFVTRKTSLPEEVKEIMMVFEGSPIQGLFYDTVIFNMPDASYESIVAAGAELYHLQRELNRRIGRTLNGKNVIDKVLINHIYNEIIYRISDVKRTPLDTKLEDDIFKQYLSNDALHKKQLETAADICR